MYVLQRIGNSLLLANKKTAYKKKQWRPPSKKKKEEKTYYKLEEQEGMPQRQHCYWQTESIQAREIL
jgi:hypothetical protein